MHNRSLKGQKIRSWKPDIAVILSDREGFRSVVLSNAKDTRLVILSSAKDTALSS